MEKKLKNIIIVGITTLIALATVILYIQLPLDTWENPAEKEIKIPTGNIPSGTNLPGTNFPGTIEPKTLLEETLLKETPKQNGPLLEETKKTTTTTSWFDWLVIAGITTGAIVLIYYVFIKK